MNSKRRNHKLPRLLNRDTEILAAAMTKGGTPPTEIRGKSNNRIFQILALSLLGAALTIAAAVLMTPLEDDATSGIAPSIESEKAVEPTLQASVPPTDNPFAVENQATTIRDFADQAEQIDVADLQKELTDLAQTLESDYANDPTSFHFAAQIYYELKQTKLAEEAWRKSIAGSTTAAGPYAGLAEIMVNSGREQEAIDLLTHVHASNIRSAETIQWLATAQENLGLLDDAKQTLDDAVQRYPKDASLWLARGRVLNQLQQYAAAEDSISKNIELEGDSEQSLFVLNTLQTRQRKLDQARATRDRLSELRKTATQPNGNFQVSYESALRDIAVKVLLSSAALAAENQQPAEAEKYLWRAIRLSPENGQAYMSLSSILRSQGRLDEAYGVHQQLIKIQPENPLNYVNFASVAVQVGEIQIAKKALLKAVQLDPTSVVAYDSLIRLHIAMGELSEAKQCANQFLEQNRSVEAYLLLASVFEAKGELTAAASAVQQAKILDPDHPVWMSQNSARSP